MMLECARFHELEREALRKGEVTMWAIIWRSTVTLMILALVAACSGSL
jgi:hypothetical protein